LIILLRALEYFRERGGRIRLTTESEQSETPTQVSQVASEISLKVKAINLSYVIIVMVLVSVAIAGVCWLAEDKGVKIEGNYIEKNGAIYINGTCIITKIVYCGRYPYTSFDVKGNGTAEVVIHDCNPEFGFDRDFNSGIIKFDTKGDIRKIIFRTDTNAMFVEIDRDRNYLCAVDNAEKFRSKREVTLTIKGEDIWVDNFKA
jgi:hypothetical protein